MTLVSGFPPGMGASTMARGAELEPSRLPKGAPVRVFNEDSYGQLLALLPQATIDATPYLHGAVVGHEGLQATQDARRALRRGRARGRRGPGLTAKASRAANTVRAGSWAVGKFVTGIASAARSSAMVGGLVSVGLHAFKVAKGQETVANGVANVAGDLVAAGIGGAVGAVAASVGTSLLGVTGVALALVGIGLGMAGYIGAEFVVRRSGLFRVMTTRVHDVVADMPARQV